MTRSRFKIFLRDGYVEHVYADKFLTSDEGAVFQCEEDGRDCTVAYIPAHALIGVIQVPKEGALNGVGT